MMSMTSLIPTLAQSNGETAGGIVFLLFWLALIVLILGSLWRVFTKAGQPGWAAIVPFYNMYIMCKIAGRPGWWIVLLFIPLVSIIVFAVLSIDIAKSFGQGVGFGVGLWLLGIIFYPILAFGSAEYQGPAAA